MIYNNERMVSHDSFHLNVVIQLSGMLHPQNLSFFVCIVLIVFAEIDDVIEIQVFEIISNQLDP